MGCHQNSESYPGLVLLNQLADEVLQLNGSNNVSEASVNVESPGSSVQNGGHADQNGILNASESSVSSMQNGGNVNDNHNASTRVLS